jgi:hypothetical protein
MVVANQPFMTPREVELFKKYLSQSTHYFEFGSGGSTVVAQAMDSVHTITSIESDRKFQEEVQGRCPRAKVRWINVGPTNEYGVPKDPKNLGLFPNYSLAYKDRTAQPDFVLVDGRFRVSCVCQVLLEEGDPIIAIHDYMQRPQYHVIAPFVDFIESADTLAVCKRKKEVNQEKLQALWKQYSVIYE